MKKGKKKRKQLKRKIKWKALGITSLFRCEVQFRVQLKYVEAFLKYRQIAIAIKEKQVRKEGNPD